ARARALQEDDARAPTVEEGALQQARAGLGHGPHGSELRRADPRPVREAGAEDAAVRRLGPAFAAGVILTAGAALALPSPRARPHGGGAHGAALDGGVARAGDAGAADAAAADASAADASVAEPASGGSVDGGAGAGDAGAKAGSGAVPTCVEHLPPGATRPMMTEHMPTRGVSGYATELKLVVAHG